MLLLKKKIVMKQISTVRFSIEKIKHSMNYCTSMKTGFACLFIGR